MESSMSAPNAEALRMNFFRMSIFFGIGHGVLTAATTFASSQLDAQVSYVGNGILNALSIPACLLVAVPLTLYVGSKGSLIIGFLCYAFYSIGFACAVVSARASAAQWYFFCIGCAFGGIGAGVLWTAQGSFLGHSVSDISKDEERPRAVVSGELATQFAFYYLGLEMVCKILFSAGLSVGASSAGISWVYCVFSVVSCVGMGFLTDVQLEIDDSTSMLAKTFDSLRLWSNVRTWLLSPTNIAFGMASAYIQGYFNANFGAVQLGDASIGYMSSFIVLIAIIASRLYGYLRNEFGTGLPLSLGAASFALIPILVLATGCSHWGLWLLVIYALQGSGRASYENTNKAVFADTFPGADTEPAFANCILQYSAASAVQYFLSAVLTGTALEFTVLVFAVLIPPAYLLSSVLDSYSDKEKEPLMSARKEPA